MKKIQIHSTKPDGRCGVLNSFPQENNHAFGDPAAQEKLWARAVLMMQRWEEVFPDDRIVVVEVDE